MNKNISPELITNQWFNTDTPLVLQQLKGKVIVVHAFQMLCPGCVSHGIPQASVINDAFSNEQVQVIGLHSVFEHHQVMTAQALKVFISEYNIKFPVAIDKPSLDSPLPQTMTMWQLQGTPSLVVFDRIGNCRLKHFGRLSDIQVGSLIGGLISEETTLGNFSDYSEQIVSETTECTEDKCRF